MQVRLHAVQCAAAEELISHPACKLTLAVHFSQVNVWFVVKQARDQNKMCGHVWKLDKRETLVGKLMWVVVQNLWLLCSRLWSALVWLSIYDGMLLPLVDWYDWLAT